MSDGHMARGGHGLPKVSPGPTVPYPSTPCKQLTLKQPYSHFKGGRPQRGRHAAVLYSFGHPTSEPLLSGTP
jgi:hypothetical protein